MGDAVALTKRDQLKDSPTAIPSFQRPRSVVDTRVDDAAVVTGLMRGELTLFFEHENTSTWLARKNLPRRRETDNAPSNHCNVEHR